MTVIKPDYYDSFVCIADKCDFTCCGNWNIAVDEATGKRFEELALPEEMGEGVAIKHVAKNDDGMNIILNKDGTCPFLNENGLCRLVLKYGEQSLSETCHTFPRERREYEDRTELGLSVGCRAVLDILWNKDSFKLVNENKNDSLFFIRQQFIELAQKADYSISVIIKMMFYILIDIDGQDYKKYFEALSYEELADALERCTDDARDVFNEDNELLLDILENYRKKGIYQRFIEPVAKSAEMCEYCEMELPEEFIREFSAFDQKLKLLLAEEIYDFLLAPDNDLYDMTIKTEWLAMEYVVIRQWMYHIWRMEGYVSEKHLRESVSVIFRIMGYCDDDIYEYMQECFEDELWDIGYLCFVLG